MFKIFKKISLLTIFLSLILCFNATKTKAYYDLDTSYVNVYVNGKFALKTYLNDLPKYIDEEPDDDDILIALNGWPANWMINDYTVNEKGELLTFDKASWDVKGEGLWNSYEEFYDQVMDAFTFPSVSGTYSTDIYLWFYDSLSTSNYADITFIVTKHGFSYEPITITWNCSNEFTYNEFPDTWWSEDNHEYETLTDGSWFIYPTSNICTSSYSVMLKGGEEYIYEYWINPYQYDDSVNDKEEVLKIFEELTIPSVINPDEQSINLPRYIGDYQIDWYSEDENFNSYLTIEYESEEFVKVIRLQDLTTSFTVNLIVEVDVDGDVETRSFNLLIKARGEQLEEPELTKQVNSYSGSTELKWNEIENADFYEIFYRTSELVYDPISDSNYLKYEYELIAIVENATTYRLPGGLEETGDYSLVVRANSKMDEFYKPSNYSNTVVYLFDTDYRQLSSPVITLSGHTLRWNPVSYAVGYELYCNNKSIATFDENTFEVDLYTLNLATGTNTLRLVALANYNEFYDSKYSNKIDYVEEVKGIVVYYNGERIKVIAKSSLSGATNLKLKESFYKALPTEIKLSTGVGIVSNYYLDQKLTNSINKEEIFDYWKNQNYCFMTLHLDAVQPLVYNGPTIIYKNPNSELPTSTITSLINSFCKDGTKDKYLLNCIEDNYTGNGNIPGNYTMKYQCLVNEFTTEIDLVIRVSSAIKVDYLYNNKWYADSIVSVEDVIITAKAVGLLPDVELKFSIVSLHNENKTDYYGTNPVKGSYNFIVRYSSAAGNEGLEQFEMNYKTGADWQYEEEASFPVLEIIITIIVSVIFIVIIVVIVKKLTKKKKYNRKKGWKHI